MPWKHFLSQLSSGLRGLSRRLSYSLWYDDGGLLRSPMTLTYLAFLGSTRESTPPRPARLGLRVARACMRMLAKRGSVGLVDPLDLPLPPPFKPHFAYRNADVPAPLADLANQIEAADAFVMISPEYNHSMSPALAHVLNHFGASLFAWKPSLIVTYSAGQWGGARAAMAMRPFLSELGCLPVSAMVHVPNAQAVFEEAGEYCADVDGGRWDGYFARGFDQLGWWGEAAALQRSRVGAASAAFTRDPTERNAP